MKHYKIFYFISLTILIYFFPLSHAHAQTLATRNSPQIMQGVRPLGMGGAFIAMDGTDENALFYNPAAINDYEKKIHMQFVLPTVETSYKGIPFIFDLIDLSGDIGDNTDSDSEMVRLFDTFATTNTGRYEELGARGPIATFMHKYVTASLFYENSTVIALTDPISNTLDLEAVSQGGLQVGSAYGFFDDLLQVGIAIKFIERYLIDETIRSRDIVVESGFTEAMDLSRFGFGIGGDIGIKAKLPIKDSEFFDFFDPTLAVTVQNVGHTRFFAGDDVGQIKQSTSFGLALHPNFWKLKSTFALDVRDLEYRKDFITQFHVGYELIWPDMSRAIKSASVRIGANQGYISGGFGMDFHYFKFNFVTYGREIGAKTRQKESRMFGMQLAAGF